MAEVSLKRAHALVLRRFAKGVAQVNLIKSKMKAHLDSAGDFCASKRHIMQNEGALTCWSQLPPNLSSKDR